MTAPQFTPVAWRYRYLHPGRVNHWIVRQSPVEACEATTCTVAIEVEPLYPPVAAELYEALSELLTVLAADANDKTGSDHPLENAFENARAALAKARGDQ